MNNTSRTFLLVALVASILLALHLLPALHLGTTELRRVSVLSDLLPDADDMDGGVPAGLTLPLPPPPPPPVVAVAPADSAGNTLPAPTAKAGRADGNNQGENTAMTYSDSTAGNTAPEPLEAASSNAHTPILDYSGGQPGGMYHFYQQLARANELGRPVRVAYYGDSFIEGDIFTADLRELLQDRFGGNGVGWVDCASKVSGFRQTVSHNTSGIHLYEVVQRPFTASNQGISQRYFTASEGARINYKGTRARKHLAQWQRATFYLRTDGGLLLRHTVDGVTTVDTVSGAPRLQAFTTLPDSTPTMSSISYQVQAVGHGTLLYGAALEGAGGVVVDNFSMRGSAGYTIANIPLGTLQQFAALRPYDLIVLQFGLNVANSSQTDYSAYIRNMGRAIAHLKQAFPQTSILVVGVPDRDQRGANGLTTMRGVEALLAYQQVMASEQHVAFFNLFEAMGGKGSMKTLVDRGLANKDYTHINFKGGRHLARLLFDSMMDGYSVYFP